MRHLRNHLRNHLRKTLHDSGKCRENAIEWHTNIVEKIENGNKPSMRRYVRMQRIDVTKCDTSCIKLWNESTTKMMKNAKTESENDIRNYFSIR